MTKYYLIFRIKQQTSKNGRKKFLENFTIKVFDRIMVEI